jgi:AcrR family transcriptional regulator
MDASREGGFPSGASDRGAGGPRACDPRASVGPDSPLTRIQRATVDLIADRGFAGVAPADVVERADVTEAEFLLYFARLEDCCVETFDCIAERCERSLYAAYDSPGTWRDRLRAAAYASARFMKANPVETRFALVEFGRATEFAKARLEWAIELYTDLIDAGREESAEPDSMSRASARSAIGSTMSLLSRQWQEEGDVSEAERFVPEMMYLAVRPYLGQEAALEELRIPPPCCDVGGAV